MKKLILVISTTIIALTGCNNGDAVPVNFNDLVGDPSTQELRETERCLSKFATKLEKDLIDTMESAVDIFNISAHKIFTDSQNNVNVQYSISGMYVHPSGEEQMMAKTKGFIDCSSQNS